MRRRPWLRRTALAFAGVVAVIVLMGWLLPVGHTATRAAMLAAAPHDVYAAISDVERYPSWWPDVSRIEPLPAVGGRVRFREHMSAGAVVMEVEEAVPPSRFVTRIADPDQPFGGTWTFEIAAAAGGSRLTITERGEVYNPVFRFMARFVFGYTATMDSCLRALETRFGVPAAAAPRG